MGTVSVAGGAASSGGETGDGRAPAQSSAGRRGGRRGDRRAPGCRGLRLSLLGGFRLEGVPDDQVLPGTSERVLAFLALHDARGPNRALVAGSLWPESSETQAAASLRSALWRLRRVDERLVTAQGQHLHLGPEVVVDVRDLEDLALQLLHHEPGQPLPDIDAAGLARELLPGYWDSWLVFERERLRQVALAALDRLVDLQIDQDRPTEAVLTGLAVVEADPLRESGTLALIRAHLACGNHSEAIRHAERYRTLLRDELGIEPSPRLRSHLAPLGAVVG